jgi:hypothetical protein
MSSIASMSGSSYASFTSSMQSSAAAGGSLMPPVSQHSQIYGTPSDSSAMFASFEAAMQSGDPRQMLVAMLALNLLLGNDSDEGQKKSDELIAGLVGLAMLGQGGVSMSYTSSMTFAQQSAQGAYAQSVTATSSFSLLG